MRKHLSNCDIETKRGIEEAIQAAIDDAAAALYKGIPSRIITERIREEWHAMERTDTFLDMAALHNTSIWLKGNGYRYYLRGATGSTYIGYLLDICSANPLPSHFLCPNCHHLQWNVNCIDTNLLPEKCVCPNDGEVLLPEGYNIPWQMLWGYGDYAPVFQMEVEERAYKDFVQYASQHWLYREIQGNLLLETDNQGIKYADILNLRIRFSIKEDSFIDTANSTDLCADDVFYYLRADGFIPKDAWRGAEHMRIGQEIPFSIRDFCTQRLAEKHSELPRYLPFKAEILEKQRYKV